MALPKLNTVTYELEMPSTQETLKYRPFLVKEQKVLMIAQESEDEAAVQNAIADVIKSCTFEKVDPWTMPSFDLEYIFLNIRGKSVGDTVDLTFRKPDNIVCGEKNKDCKEMCSIKINIEDINVDDSKVKDSKIQLTDDIGVKMNYPHFDTLQKFANDGNEDHLSAENIFKVINECVEYIWDGDEIYKAKDSTKKELTDFLDSLNVAFCRHQFSS